MPPRIGLTMDCCQFQPTHAIPKTQHSCFVPSTSRRHALRRRASRIWANTCSRRSCLALQSIAGLATLLQTPALARFSKLSPGSAGGVRCGCCCDRRAQSGVARACSPRISAQHRGSWTCYCYAKMALRDLRGTAPGTAQRFLDAQITVYGRENVQQVHCQFRCCAAAAHARASMRRRRNLTGQWRRPNEDGTPDSMQAISSGTTEGERSAQSPVPCLRTAANKPRPRPARLPVVRGTWTGTEAGGS
jgi:hypothetical protein